MEERRRTDLYRLLGAPPLATPDTLRQCWLDFAKTGHPDVGGDAGRFRLVKEAYEILRDPERRAEYERFWVRALGPFERVAPADEGVATVVARPAIPAVAGERRVVMVVKKPAMPAAETDQAPDGTPALRHRAARLFAARDVIDRRIHPVLGGSMGGIGALLSRVEEALAPVTLEDIERLRAEVERGIAQLETVRVQLDTVAAMKRTLAV
ncbi:MAG: J domain-containing protein [bacterium]|nr:J domain-containing protein [bacterium]